MATPQPSPLRRRVAEHASRFPEFDTPSVGLFLAVREVAEAITARISERIQEGGLSFAAVKLLSVLEGPEAAELSQSQLGARLGVTRANMTGLLEGLERKGLVERSASPEDRRARHARLTPAGREALSRALATVYREMRDMLSGLPPGEVQDLATRLERVRETLTP